MDIYYTLICLSESVVHNLILDFKRLCEIEVLNVEKSNVWSDVAVPMSSLSSDDNKLVELSRIPMLLLLMLEWRFMQLGSPVRHGRF